MTKVVTRGIVKVMPVIIPNDLWPLAAFKGCFLDLLLSGGDPEVTSFPTTPQPCRYMVWKTTFIATNAEFNRDNFERDMMSFTWSVCVQIRGPTVILGAL